MKQYKEITQIIQRKLLEFANVLQESYTAVLMQNSGKVGVESVLASVIGEGEKVLIIVNGSYGQRMVKMAMKNHVNYEVYHVEYDQIPSAKKVAELLEKNKEITHVSMVHCETTTGILNNIKKVTKVVKNAGRSMIVDATSSFGGIEIKVEEWGIDFIIGSANRCMQGIPGVSFVICKKDKLEKTKGKAKKEALDLYQHWICFEKSNGEGGLSENLLLQFAKALEELEEEGGIKKRQKRYLENNQYLTKHLANLGIKTYIGEENQSPIITTFLYPPNPGFSFETMYDYIKKRGYPIYPGKVTEMDTFRIGNIGAIYLDDMKKLCDSFEEFLEEVVEEGKRVVR